jgi:hypothetical protein
MNALLVWMSCARNDKTIIELYRGVASWADIPIDEPLYLHPLEEIIIETTEELTEIRITDGIE